MDEAFIVPASKDDVTAIVSVLAANRNDPGLFQESELEASRNLSDFLVARSASGQILGCAALHRDRPALAEVFGVAVLPEFQGQGIGARLLQECLQNAAASGIEQLWLATIKPEYFSRFGFRPISRWDLPASVLLRKLRQVFQQPAARWPPALFGRHTFMRRSLRS